MRVVLDSIIWKQEIRKERFYLTRRTPRGNRSSLLEKQEVGYFLLGAENFIVLGTAMFAKELGFPFQRIVLDNLCMFA